MNATDVLWFIGELGAAWLFGFGAGLQWNKFKQALYAAVDS